MAILKLGMGELLVNDIPANEALADIELTNRFIKLAQQLKKIAPRSDDFLYFSAVIMTGAEASLIDPKTGEPKKDRQGKVITGGYDEHWNWTCSDPSIDPYRNQNGDIFPSTELKTAYTKFISKPLCVNHQSADVEGIRGIIIDAHWDEKFKRVVGLCALDKIGYPDLAHKIKIRTANSTSMGTAVGRCICSSCHKVCVVEKDYCDCLRSKKGQRINGVMVSEINLDLAPIELSIVASPADPQAKVIKIIASMNNYVDQRNSLLETKEVLHTEKLATLDTSIKSIELQLNRLFSECSDNSCQFVKSADGHINLVKGAQVAASTATWKDFLDTAKHVDLANDYEKKDLFDKLDDMRKSLDINALSDDNKALLDLADVMGSKNKYLHSNILQPIIEDLRAAELGQPQSMREQQFTTPDGADKDLGLDSGSEVSMPANEQQTGGRVSKVVNPGETEPKPNKGGDLGPELGTSSDRFQFGNYASKINELIVEGKTANIDENLNLLLKQTQEIETEMNTIKEQIGRTTNNVVDNRTTTPEELKMNEARLKLREAQRLALIEKRAEKEDACEVCEKAECVCEKEEKKEASFKVISGLKCKECGVEVADRKEATSHAETKHKGQDVTFGDYKKSYWLGTTEPTPGKPQYKPDNGGEPKIRMNDKQMFQDGKMGGPEGLFPGDEAEKKKLLRAELENRAMKRRAYWLGTEEPKPGKEQYKKDPLAAKDRFEDKQMLQDKSMGGDDGLFPGDEAEKKKLLRAEFVPGVLRTKFTKLRNTDGSLNKQASYFEIFSGENKILKATAEEIYGDDLEKVADGSEKTYWDVLSSPEYGKEVMATIRSDGFSKVAYLLKGAQGMPELPPAMDAAGPAAPPVNAPVGESAPAGQPTEGAQKVEVDPNELMALVGEMEESLNRLKTEVTGENDSDVKDVSVDVADNEDQEGAENVGAELQASLLPLAREVYSELDQSADELALLVGYYKKASILSATKKAELNALAVDAVNDGKALLDEAETILAVAGKIPAGLKAFQDKQKEKKKGKDKDEDKKDKKAPKKEDKADKKKKDEKDKKKPKKADFIEALKKLANELGEEVSPSEEAMEEALGLAEPEHHKDDELDKEMKELGLMPTDEADDEACGMCGMAMDEAHYCTASAKDQLVKEALATRKARREAILKAAQDKKYDVVPDTHGLIDEAHKGAEANPTTHLDNKPAGDGAMVEGLDKKHDAMLNAAESVPTGKQGAAAISVKEAELKAVLELGIKAKKAEDDKTKFRVKLRRAYDLGLAMQDKGMTPRTKEALDVQVDEIMKFDDLAFESFKRVIANTNPVVKTASSTRGLPQPGVREDNSKPEDVVSPDLRDQLKTLW